MQNMIITPYMTLESLTDLCRRLYERMGILAGKNEYFEYYSSLPYLAYQNRMMIKKLPDDEKLALEILDEALAIAKDEKSPMFFTFCDDINFPMEQFLKSKGMSQAFCQAGMAYIAGKQEITPEQSVMKIDNSRLGEWCETCDKAFGKKDEVRTYEKLMEDEKCAFYACEADGKIVSTGMYCIDDNNFNVGIHSIGTLSEYRGRRYAASVVSQIIVDAEKKGLPLLTLQASPFGEPVYTGLGFEKITTIYAYS